MFLNLDDVAFLSYYARFFNMLQNITTSGLWLYFPTQGRIFIALGNASPLPGLKPRPLNRAAITLITTPVFLRLWYTEVRQAVPKIFGRKKKAKIVLYAK
jgi:hypothetical protein